MLYSVAVTLAETGMTIQYKDNEEIGLSTMMRTFFQLMMVTAVLTGNRAANSLPTHMHKGKLQQHLAAEIM